MGLNKKTGNIALYHLLFILVGCNICFAGWTGPSEIVSGSWGTAPGQFDIRHEDTQDIFPTTLAVSSSGRIAISEDQAIKRIQIFYRGVLEKTIDTFAFDMAYGANDDLFVSGGGFRRYDVTGILQLNKTGVSFDKLYSSPEGNIIAYDNDNKTYYVYAASGQRLNTSKSRPLELGVVEGSVPRSGMFLQKIKYPDKTFSFLLPWRTLKAYQRDSAGDLIVDALTDSKDAVYMIGTCGKILVQMQMPADRGHIIQQSGAEPVSELDYEYGSPVIAPNGDVYTWKRTPDKYSILKWTWVDDPSISAGPDAPTGFKVSPAATGISLTWTASPQDPGCVTGYEIARSATPAGAHSTIATVKSGVLKYDDTSVGAGGTYYYKVRAVSGKEHSPFTPAVSGKR